MKYFRKILTNAIFENISLEISGNDFNLTTNVNKKKLKFQISNPKSKIPEADVTNKNCENLVQPLLLKI